MSLPSSYDPVDIFLHYALRVVVALGLVALVFILWDGLGLKL